MVAKIHFLTLLKTITNCIDSTLQTQNRNIIKQTSKSWFFRLVIYQKTFKKLSTEQQKSIFVPNEAICRHQLWNFSFLLIALAPFLTPFAIGKTRDSAKGLTLNPFLNKPWFLHVCSTSLLKTLWEKQKLLMTSNFSFSHSVFYPFGELSDIFIQFGIAVCKFFQFGRV